MTRRSALAIGSLALAAGLAAAGGPPPEDAPKDLAALARPFAYDAAAPLDLQEVRSVQRYGFSIHDVTYASPVSGRVQAFLLVPDYSGPFPAVMFGHWGEGDRTEFLGEAETYARAGVVCLLPDYPWVRPPQWRRTVNNLDRPREDLATYVQAAIDLRRGLDLLLARKDVDPKRVGYVGHSFGAQFGAILAAVDRRVAAAVLVAGIPDLEAVFLRPSMEDVRRGLPAGQLDAYLAGLAPVSAVRFVPYAAPAPLLFQFSEFEPNFPREAMDRYYAAASEPKSVLWYDAGHEMADPRASRDRWAFLAGPLRLPKEPLLGAPGR